MLRNWLENGVSKGMKTHIFHTQFNVLNVTIYSFTKTLFLLFSFHFILFLFFLLFCCISSHSSSGECFLLLLLFFLLSYSLASNMSRVKNLRKCSYVSIFNVSVNNLSACVSSQSKRKEYFFIFSSFA